MDKSTHQLVRHAGLIQLNAAIIVTIVLPTAIALVSKGILGETPIYVWFVLIAFQVVFGWLHFRGTTYLQTLLDVTQVKLLQEEESQEQLSRLAAQSVLIQYTLNFIEVSYEDKLTISKLPDLNNLLQPIDANRGDTFGFEESEALYSYALFLLDGNQLVIRARIKDMRLQVRNRRRAVGEGHAGIAFQQNRIWISPDATQEELLKRKKNHNGNDEAPIEDSDKTKYISFISIPFHAGSSQKPVGVLTITSSQAGQFTNAQYMQFCEVYQDILSMFFVQFPEFLDAKHFDTVP